MAQNLGLGTAMIALVVLVHTLGLTFLAGTMQRIVRWFRLHHHHFGKTIAMVLTVLGVFAIHTLEIWGWAGLYLYTGAVKGIESAVYFSTVTFSTVGYGDITLDQIGRAHV